MEDVDVEHREHRRHRGAGGETLETMEMTLEWRLENKEVLGVSSPLCANETGQ